MSEAQAKAQFEEIVRDVRSDLENLRNLYAVLASKVGNSSKLDNDIANWIFDVFLDKLYSFEATMKKIAKETGTHAANTVQTVSAVADYANNVAYPRVNEEAFQQLPSLAQKMGDLTKWTEWDLVNMRRSLSDRGWSGVAKVKPMEFITSERKKYVTAREEVEKAKENLKKNSHEDVMNHARTAIDLAIKERFGFKKIPKMKTFIEQADKLSFPLPSYDLIYSYFNEGNERMHEGKIHTTFEGYEVIRTISNFIDALETVQISPQQLQKFVDDCECVKMDSA